MIIVYYGADHSWFDLSNSIGFQRRNTCLIKQLAENPQIQKLYIVHRTTKWKLIRFLYQRTTKKDGKVIDLYFASILPEIGFLENFFRMINRVLNKNVIRFQIKNTKSEFVHWCYWPKGFQDFAYIGLKGRLIFDADHNILDDPNLNIDKKATVKDLLLQVSKNADLIFSTSRIMNQWFEKQGAKNVKRIRNGVDVERFPNINNGKKGLKPIVGYCGTLSKWIDQNLLENLIKRNSQWNFWIIGEDFKTDIITRIGKYDNVKLFGKIAANRISELFMQFDVALSLYSEMEGMDVDSMKIFEYLAAGVPVISTKFHGYLDEDFEGLLYLEKDVDGFERSIKKCITMDEFENENRNIKSKNFVNENTWGKRVTEILNYINA